MVVFPLRLYCCRADRADRGAGRNRIRRADDDDDGGDDDGDDDDDGKEE